MSVPKVSPRRPEGAWENGARLAAGPVISAYFFSSAFSGLAGKDGSVF